MDMDFDRQKSKIIQFINAYAKASGMKVSTYESDGCVAAGWFLQAGEKKIHYRLYKAETKFKKKITVANLWLCLPDLCSLTIKPDAEVTSAGFEDFLMVVNNVLETHKLV